MRIRTDHCITRYDQSFFRQQSVFNTHFAYVIKVCNVLFTAEITAHFTLLSCFDVLVRSEVIHNHSNLILVKDVFSAQLIEFLYGNRRCNVVAQYQIKIYQNQLSCFDLVQSRMSRKYFLRHCHAHLYQPSFYFIFLLS